MKTKNDFSALFKSDPIKDLSSELYGLLVDGGLSDFYCVETVMRLMVYVAKKTEMQHGEWEIACSNMTDAIFEDIEDIT